MPSKSKASKEWGSKAGTLGKAKRPGATDEQMRRALRVVFVGGEDGKLISVRKAAGMFEGVTKSVLGRIVEDICGDLRREGFNGYGKAAMGKRRFFPVPKEGTKLREKLEGIVSSWERPVNMGRWASYLLPDEEKLLVDIVELRDFYGFGLDRRQLQVMARAWVRKATNLTNVDCGPCWFLGFMKRAKQYKPDFGETKRSKMDVMRAAKQSRPVINKFFDMVSKIYAYHKKLGHFVGEEPAPEDVYNVDEVHANPEAKHKKKLGSSKRNRKFVICSGDKFPFHVTIVVTTSADGKATIPPQIIHTGIRMNANVIENIKDDFCVHLSPSGSQDKVGFERWCRHFVSWARKGKKTNLKTFLFLYGHNSRCF